jgi:hypothetical protein
VSLPISDPHSDVMVGKAQERILHAVSIQDVIRKVWTEFVVELKIFSALSLWDKPLVYISGHDQKQHLKHSLSSVEVIPLLYFNNH